MSRISFNRKQARDLYYALQWGMSEVGNRIAQEDFYEFEYPDQPTEDKKEMERLKKINKRLKSFLEKPDSQVKTKSNIFLEWD